MASLEDVGTPVSEQQGAFEPTGRLVRNTTLIAVSAVFISVILHEYAHAVAQLMLDAGARVRAIDSSVLRPISERQHAATALAGPVFSLCFGALVLVVRRGFPQGYLRTLGTWLGLASMQNFFGYLIISPIEGTDSGVALKGFGMPQWLAFVLIGVGIVGMVALARVLGHEMGAHTDGLAQWRATMVTPWLLATAVIAVLYTIFALVIGYAPELLPLVISGPATALVFAPMGMMFVRQRPFTGQPLRTGSTTVVVTVFVISLLVVAFHAFIGVTLGASS